MVANYGSVGNDHIIFEFTDRSNCRDNLPEYRDRYFRGHNLAFNDYRLFSYY